MKFMIYTQSIPIVVNSNIILLKQYHNMFQAQNKNKVNQVQKTTTGDEQKRYQLIQKLVSHNPEMFRQININDYDLNITENFQELEYIDDVITPLIYCAHFGLKEIMKFILKNKQIDPDLQTKNNRQTPLTVACMKGNYEIARMLVIAGAQVNKPNIFNYSPLAVIIFRLIQQPGSFENNKICFRLAEFLLDHGADINWIVDKKRGYSLLHYFCAIKTKLGKAQKQLNITIIKFLLDKGADTTQKTLKDQTIQDLLETHCNKQNILNLVKQTQIKSLSSKQRIPKHQIKKLGQNYFKLPQKKSKN